MNVQFTFILEFTAEERYLDTTMCILALYYTIYIWTNILYNHIIVQQMPSVTSCAMDVYAFEIYHVIYSLLSTILYAEGGGATPPSETLPSFTPLNIIFKDAKFNKTND